MHLLVNSRFPKKYSVHVTSGERDLTLWDDLLGVFYGQSSYPRRAYGGTLSISAASWASEFSNVLVFGDRQVDAGQFVDSRTVFPDDPDEEITTDGRGRFTNFQPDGNIGHTWSTLVSRQLGHGDTHPNQPQTLPNSPPVTVGTNYAAGFYDTFDILQSINGTPVIGGITYRDGDTERTVPGTTGTGILRDEARIGWVANSIVLLNGGSEDVRFLADIDRNLDESIDLRGSRIIENEFVRERIAQDGADRISTGAVLLRDAGAGLVVVSNLIDVGRIPEVPGDVGSAQEAIDALDEVLEDRRSTDPEAQFTEFEIEQRLEFEALLNDPTLISTVRTDGTNVFNARLSQNLDGETNIVVIDQHGLYDRLLEEPALFGLSEEVNHGVDCLFNSVLYPCAESDADLSDQLFSDGLDLSTTAHEIFAQHAASVINAPVLISGVPFTAIASSRELNNIVQDQVVAERIAHRGWAPFVSANIGQSTWNGISGEGRQGALRVSGAGGATYSFGNGVAVGAAASYQNISDSLSETAIGYDGSAVHGTVFAGADFGRVFGNASATVGRIGYDDIERQTRLGDGIINNSGSSDSNVFGLSAEVGVRALNNGIISAGPIASIDHYSASLDGYSEDGWEVTAVEFDDVDASSTRASLGLFLEAGDINDTNMPAVFRVKALYTRELDTDGDTVTARAASSPNNTFSREGRGAQADSITVGAQLTYDFGSFIGSLGYDARIGESDDHAGRVDISVPLGSK